MVVSRTTIKAGTKMACDMICACRPIFAVMMDTSPREIIPMPICSDTPRLSLKENLIGIRRKIHFYGEL